MLCISHHLVITISSEPPNDFRSNHSECCYEAWIRSYVPPRLLLQDQAVEVPEELPEEFFRWRKVGNVTSETWRYVSSPKKKECFFSKRNEWSFNHYFSDKMLDFGGGILSWKCPIRVLGNWAKNWNPKWFPYTEIDKFLTRVSIWKSGTPEIFERWIIDLHTRTV